jgi:hypothetical protein
MQNADCDLMATRLAAAEPRRQGLASWWRMLGLRGRAAASCTRLPMQTRRKHRISAVDGTVATLPWPTGVGPLLIILFALAAPAAAQGISLAQPIDCVLGDTCFVQQLTDHDPGSAASDFRCGPQTYDGHKGTDFALPSLKAEARGVNVLSAADGTVRNIRDGMPDILQGQPGAPDVSDRECGNGLVIDHGDGWETQYCHMKQGSVAVQPGQTVATGTVLGQVGLSGRTEFPHLHLAVRHDGAVVDPFDPDGIISCGAPSTGTLWSVPMDPAPGGVVALGLTDHEPDYDAVKAGTALDQGLLPDPPRLIVWGYLFGGQPGDSVNLRIDGPQGTIIDHAALLTRNQAQLMRFVGKPQPRGGWPAGHYEASVSLTRDGEIIDSRTTGTEIR